MLNIININERFLLCNIISKYYDFRIIYIGIKLRNFSCPDASKKSVSSIRLFFKRISFD